MKALWQLNPMRLSLFKFDPETLQITKHVILDNTEGSDVADGYYAMPFWRKTDGKTLCNVITYKRLAGHMPDIIQLQFDWEELK